MASRGRKARRQSTPVSAVPIGPRSLPDSELVRFGSRFFTRVQSLSDYVCEINDALPAHITPVVLVDGRSDTDHPAYVRLIREVLIGWSDSSQSEGQNSDISGSTFEQTLPDNLAEGLTTKAGTFPHKELISRVITSTLNKYPQGFDAQSKNVLCNGFALGRPNGKGSVFRNLDARAPSGAVNILLSPPWRLLINRLGHVVFRHLLSHAALLVSVSPSAASSSTSKRSFLTLMQLCGPLPRRRASGQHAKDDAVQLSLKKNVLYHGSLAVRRGSDHQHIPALNTGLPTGHKLQTLQAGNSADAKQLFLMIFHSTSRKRSRADQVGDGSSDFVLREKKRARGHGWAVSRVASTNAASRDNCATDEHHARSARIPARLQSTLPILETVIARVGKRSFRAILSDACPLAADDNPMRSKKRRTSRELARMSTKPTQVARFVIRSLRQAFPLRVFGSLKNRAVFEGAVHTLLKKRTQNEYFDIKHFFDEKGFCVKDVTWLYRNGKGGDDCGRRVCNPTDHRFRVAHLRKLCVWLVRSFCIPLLSHNFYVSESESSRHRVVYFRREVWASLTDATLDVMMKSDQRQFSLLSTSALAGAMRQRDKVVSELNSSFCPSPVFIYSQIRFLPKSSGARGIQRPRGMLLQSFSESRGVFASKVDRIPTSAVLQKAQVSMKIFYANTLEILWSESRFQRSPLGASIFSSNDIYAKHSSLTRGWQQAGRPRMFVVCMDITRSFDTVPLSSLLKNVLRPLLQRERYVVLRYAIVKRNITNKQPLRRFCHYVCEEPGEEAHFPRLVKNKLRSRHRGALFIDLVSVSVVTRKDLMASLEEVLTNNVVLVPRRVRRRSSTAYAVQSQGLPQGSQLSSILTSLFYGYVERADLPEFLSDRDDSDVEAASSLQLFMRQIDDTLYIGANRDGARRLAERMTRGWDDTHGFVINPTKTRASFDPGVGGITNLRLVPWCGYIFDAHTLEVRGDYDRYVSKECRLRDTLSIVHGEGAMETFYKKASTCFRPKLHAILLDSKINSKRTVALNLYQAALLSALKLSSYAGAVLPKRQCRADPNAPKTFAKIVEAMLDKFRALVGLAVTNVVALQNDCTFPLEQYEVHFLVVQAYLEVIRKHLPHVWYSSLGRKQLEQKQAALRFARHRGRVIDLQAAYQSVLHVKASPALWSLRL